MQNFDELAEGYLGLVEKQKESEGKAVGNFTRGDMETCYVSGAQSMEQLQEGFEGTFGQAIGSLKHGFLVRRKAIQWFTVLCVIESAAGFCVGMWLCFVEYNVWVLATACLLYGTLVSEFIGKCLMTFRPRLWNEHEREVYDNNNDVVCGIYCIAGYVCALLFMPSLKVAMFIWGLCCAIDNIGWLVVYHRNKDKFTED